ncbi:gcn5-related n-acetyltransferase [Pseudovirgaria hyperparasitica]|uniref:Gcn5-related n-acetyltransferase n=1 Tax=Pseudovirgaria hyperparasitica TaxID=470096 RepID=A0A6A6WIZ0_9PEZI|nr:gcn5-related n-acetyltransferase [Pseudovirgaria hyperparasitica]KAF2762144.1 gcn5-related n-acetyltransferase [Pseudovirgaria hyperparasitica]
MSSEAQLRHATKEDVPVILSLINELAAYENALNEVKATEDSLLETLVFAPFSQQSEKQSSPTPRAARALLVVSPEGDVAGMALYFYNYSTWHAKPGIYLEDLYVSPKYRRHGYGTILLKALAKEVVGMGGKRLEWWCLKWNEPSLKFYEGLGATQMTDWISLRVDGDKLLELANEA